MTSSHTRLTISALLLAVAAAGSAQNYFTGPAPPPSPGLLNEWLRKQDVYNSAWDVGAQVRVRYEDRNNFFSGANDFKENTPNPNNSYWLQRVKPRVGYSAEWFSVLVEGRGSYSTGDNRDPNPEADGPMDLHQAYVTLGNHKEFPLSLKVGRQELSYGDERILGAFDWNNLGRVFDAAKLRWQNPYFAADFFTSRVVIPDDNNFNEPNDYDWFSGFYATSKLIPKQTTELYFLSRNTAAGSRTVNGAGLPALLNGPPPRDIYTIGLRVKSLPGEFGNWDYTGEFMGQFGHFNDPALPAGQRSLEHEAFAVFLGGGYTWTKSTLMPRLGVEYNFGSGDDDPTDGEHGTFENLFPTNHKFYGFMDLLSLQNIHNVRLTSSIKPVPRLTLTADYHLFWLADTQDNLYTVAGARRGGIGTTTGTGYGINPGYDSFVGSEVDFIATFALKPWATIQGGYAHFFVGDYVEQSLAAPAVGSTDANWFYVQMNFSF
ncbi:MAG: alginate export family protein [Verrucomicrobia bacterium]|nr:alginate export family protein [Verrucomicrobiota bacterium]